VLKLSWERELIGEMRCERDVYEVKHTYSVCAIPGNVRDLKAMRGLMSCIRTGMIHAERLA
jgi:hypothetical protein